MSYDLVVQIFNFLMLTNSRTWIPSQECREVWFYHDPRSKYEQCPVYNLLDSYEDERAIHIL